jgi:hypothetical protein
MCTQIQTSVEQTQMSNYKTTKTDVVAADPAAAAASASAHHTDHHWLA